ncbi:MAG: ATP-binding protein, partial [Bdellovibrionota bacterium]
PSFPHWFFEKLKHLLDWPSTDKCILVAVTVLPFPLANIVMARRVLSDPLGVSFFNPSAIPDFIWIQTFLAVAWALLLSVAIVSRKRSPESRLLVHATVHLFSVPAGFFVYYAGPLINPAPLTIPISLMAGGLLFGWRMAGAALLSGVSALVVSKTLERMELIPYSPLLAGSLFQDSRVLNWWFSNVGVPTFTFLLMAMIIAGLILSRWQERERALAEAYGDLEKVGDDLYRVNEGLEERVRERTAELLRANEHLRQEMGERQSLEDQLVQARKMEAVGLLTGGIAHEFNNMVTVINGYAALLRRSLPSGSRESQSAGEILAAGERAAGLTRQLLAFSRKQILQPRFLNLNETVRGMAGMLRQVIGETIHLGLALGENLGTVKADPSQIEQVILNLAINARDAMPHGGKLTLETANVVLGEDYTRQHVDVTPGPYVLLAVGDTGTGMDKETLTRVFEPFFTTKEAGKGTGLGLATVYGIVRQSGGHVWVYSEPGQGSLFKVYLPRLESVTTAEPNPAEPAVPRGSETILVVEDEAMIRTLVQDALSELGYRVLEAATPKEALAYLEAHAGAIDLLLTDVVMPELSGRQLAGKAKALRPSLRVLYMSGYTDNAIVHHGVLDEGVAFLQKPFTPDLLARKIREVLDGRGG